MLFKVSHGLVPNNRTSVIEVQTMLGSSLLQFVGMHLGLIPACYRKPSARILNQKLLTLFHYY